MKKSTPVKSSLEQRKKDHIELALQSRLDAVHADQRFYYEPILRGHPVSNTITPFEIAGKQMKYPIWVSSMTGGTSLAATINKRLAKVSKVFGLGMGLGSCRVILDRKDSFKDFDVRKEIGEDAPLFANLGIAQIERINREDAWDKIIRMIRLLRADGLIIHINPLQEWFQPEGDRILHPPIDSIQAALKQLQIPLIVKEVGQGMGPESLKELMQLPLEAIEFAALGGTNFSVLELKRNTSPGNDLNPLIRVGHTAEEMVAMVNTISKTIPDKVKCRRFIISGGIDHFLDGYYLIKKLNYPAVYGQASALLTPARQSEKELYHFIKTQIEGLQIAYNYLSIR